jgi:hypothetical protein
LHRTSFCNSFCKNLLLTKAQGGIITFNCGSNPVTIPITITRNATLSTDTIIDGGNLITLSGQNNRILAIQTTFNLKTPKLTVQNIKFVNGKTNDIINTKSTTQGGAALYRLGG